MTTSAASTTTQAGAAVPKLKRVLGLSDLLVYGMIIMQVVAPIPIFGQLEKRSDGHAATVVLIAMVAMMITAVSYGRMAMLYPMAGSAYTYVARSVNPHLGFLTGWSMFLDYLVIPLISAIIIANAIQGILPGVPFSVLALVVVTAMTVLNLYGIRATVRANAILLVISSAAVVCFLILAARYLFAHFGWGGLVSLHPVYNPATFERGTILAGVSLAAMNYIGFDGLTTLAEDSINPKRDIILSMVLIVLITGVLSAIELYFLHQVLPDWRAVEPKDLDTSYLAVMRSVGGMTLFVAFSVVMSVSQFGAGFSVQVSAARLLYGMGRDNVLPRALFGYLSPRRGNPSRNIILVGILAFVGSVLVPFDHACDLLNFGAYVGFMGVNLATFISYFVRPPQNHRRNFLWDAALPACGFILCLVFWLGLPNLAKLAGGGWLLFGLVYCAIKTGGFRRRPLLFDFGES
jgi:amino acid transporter